jgi:hypothetical protein
VIAVGAYVGVSAIIGFVAGFADREWLLVWSLGLVFLLGWRNRQPVLRALYDWLPLLVILAAYDLVRSRADSLIERAHLEPMIWFDELIGFGTAWTVRLQDALFNAQHPHWYDYGLLVVYSSHFVTAITVGACVYFVARARFTRYVFTFLVCSLAGFATYVIFPAIPPWMASEQGALPHTYRAVDVIWSHIGLDFLANVFSGDPKYSNPVGALPSLHAAYPLLLVLLFWSIAGPKVRVVLVTYVFAMAFALVYFAEHYVFDLLAGYVYAVAAFWIVGRILDRRSSVSIDADAEAPADG